MSDVTLSYKGSDILELSDSGSATLKTGGKYCEDDIAVEYVKPSGGSTSPWELIADYTSDADANSIVVTIPTGKQQYNIYKVQYNGTASVGDWPRPTMNGGQCSYINQSGVRSIDFSMYFAKSPSSALGSNKRFTAVWAGTRPVGNNDAPLETVGLIPYSSSTTYYKGFNIKVWRLVEP